jgi:hypothetical protein
MSEEVRPLEIDTRLESLRATHRGLDERIAQLISDGHQDQVELQRLKKQKLALKDRIAHLESDRIPRHHRLSGGRSSPGVAADALTPAAAPTASHAPSSAPAWPPACHRGAGAPPAPPVSPATARRVSQQVLHHAPENGAGVAERQPADGAHELLELAHGAGVESSSAPELCGRGAQLVDEQAGRRG